MTYRQIVNDYFTWTRDFVKEMSQCAILLKKLVFVTVFYFSMSGSVIESD